MSPRIVELRGQKPMQTVIRHACSVCNAQYDTHREARHCEQKGNPHPPTDAGDHLNVMGAR